MGSLEGINKIRVRGHRGRESRECEVSVRVSMRVSVSVSIWELELLFFIFKRGNSKNRIRGFFGM